MWEMETQSQHKIKWIEAEIFNISPINPVLI